MAKGDINPFGDPRAWYEQQYKQGKRLKEQAEAAEAQKRADKFAKFAKQRETRLGEYQKLQEGQFQDLTRGFRQFSEAQTGRALGSVLRQAELGAGRRGIAFSGLAGRGATEAQAGLQGQALGAQQQFASQLGALQAQNASALMRDEYRFENEMATLHLQQEFRLQLTQMQAKLQRDQESRNAFWGLGGSIGEFLGEWGSKWLPLPKAK
jgi:hypothetical protein